jgi:predicted nucleic acid-binding protein
VAIVVNSGPLISLARIGLLDLLPELFDEILVPDAVFQDSAFQEPVQSRKRNG